MARYQVDPKASAFALYPIHVSITSFPLLPFVMDGHLLR
jgi:hypothetical protein